MRRRARVLVAGAGPAGSATARRLANRGLDVLLVERSRFGEPRVGESLAPAVQPLLRELGLWEGFLALRPLPSYGTRSSWGSADQEVHSHLASPWGCGWHVDRRAVDAMLATAAADAGARLLTGVSVQAVEWVHDRWRARLSSGAEVEADVVVDAVGRPARVARSLGAGQHRFDRLVALSAVASDAPAGPHLVVETTPDGWWYESPLPGGGVVVMLLTDADECRRMGLTDGDRWRRALARTDHAAAALRGRVPCGDPRVHPATSSRLSRRDALAWLAVGDAALAVDPVSGSGVLRALRTAAAAADAVVGHLAGDDLAFIRYEGDRDSECTAYLLERAAYYAAEQRWTSPFWDRRRCVPAPA